MKAMSDLQTNMATSVDTKLNAFRDDMNIRDKAFQEKIIEINNQSAMELKASLDEALFDAAEVKIDSPPPVMGALAVAGRAPVLAGAQTAAAPT